MSLKESKIKLLKSNYNYSEKLLNICNKIEYNLNYVNSFEYSKYNLINIHSVNENTFNFSFENNYNVLINNYSEMNKKEFNYIYSFVYKQLNYLIDLLENIIKMYSKYIKKDILLKVQINNLMFNTEIDNKFISEFFNNFEYFIFNF